MSRVVLPALVLAALAGGCGGDRPSDRATTPQVLGQGHIVAHVSRTTWLRASPGGRRLARLPRRTEFGSARVLAVVGWRGPWVAVLAPELPNHRVGWLDSRRNTRLLRIPYSMEVALGPRRLIVRHLGRVVARVPVAVGRPGTSTPIGRYAVTDKVATGNPGGPYGCCALALTGHQPRLPQGWGGGDRLAIHATAATETIGQAVSLGCVRTTNEVMRRLFRRITLGTPVRVRR
jgi:L,D-transpeptidase catalytic domain